VPGPTADTRLDLAVPPSTLALVTPSVRSAARDAAAPASRRDRPAPEASAWPTVRAGSRRLFVIALLVAVVAHLPALPFDPLFLARILLHTAAPAPTAQEPEEVLVPVDLDLLADAPSSEASPGSSAPAASEPAAPAAPAGDSAPASPAAPASDPAPAKAAPAVAAKDAGDIYDELDKPKRGTPTLKDPLATAGGPGKFKVKSPHTQVLFNGNRLRGNSAGGALGGVLTAIPEWKSFFEGTKVDPIADADHLLIAGPQFRRSKDVVVWMQYRGSEADMRAAIDTLIQRSPKGTRARWLEDSPVPAAVAVAHNHKRIFALVPGKKLLAILPATAKAQLADVKGVKPFNGTSKAGIVIALDTPRNAFAGYEEIVDVPKTFKWMRMVVTPLTDGGADVALEIGDASAESAAANAPIVEKQLSQVRTLASLATIIGAEVLPPMKVDVDGDILRVKITVSRKGLAHILNLARTHFSKKAPGDDKVDPDVYEDEEASDKKGKSENGAAAAGSGAPSSSGEASGSPATSTQPASTGVPAASAAQGGKPPPGEMHGTQTNRPRIKLPKLKGK